MIFKQIKFIYIICLFLCLKLSAYTNRNDTQTAILPATNYVIKLKSRTIFPFQEAITTSENSQAPDQKVVSQLEFLKNSLLESTNESLHVLLQLKSIPTPAEKSAMKNNGITLLKYVPNYAWLARVDKKAAGLIITHPLICWGDILQPKDKLSPSLLQKNISTEIQGKLPLKLDAYKSGSKKIKLRVQLFMDVSVSNFIAQIEQIKIISASEQLNLLTIKLAPDKIYSLLQMDEVEWIDALPPPLTTFNDAMRESVNANQLQATPRNLSGLGIRMAMWDGGQVDPTHGDFDIRLLPVDTDQTVNDHATHVAGIFGGSGKQSAEYSGSDFQWRGVAPQAEIIVYDYYNDPWREHEFAIKSYHADLSQNTWGYSVGWDEQLQSNFMNRSYFGDYTLEANAFDKIVRGIYGKKIPVCFAIGNDRNDTDPGTSQKDPLHPEGYKCVVPPATAKNVITVGAISSDNDGMTTFSNWGPTDDGRLKPELVAPGSHSTRNGLKSTMPPNQYGTLFGTSMAAPVAAGAIALLMERAEKLYEGVQLLPSTYKALLVNTAEDIGQPGPDFKNGFGKLNILNAEQLINTLGFIEAAIVQPAEIDIYNIIINSGDQELKVTLAWDDPAATALALDTLINNLDLTLVDPNNVVHLPLMPAPSNPGAVAIQRIDSINNIEQVKISNPVPGKWKIMVKGTTVPESPQSYSLASEHIVGSINSQIITVNNDGGAELVVSNVTHQEAWLNVGISSFTVAPGEAEGIMLTLNPAGLSPGEYNDIVLLESNDLDTPEISVPVTLTISEPNRVPETPHSPLPAHNSIKQLTYPTLSWRTSDPDAGDILTYDVYLGSTSGNLALESKAQLTQFYNKKGLDFDTKYYWQVIVRDKAGAIAISSQWSFRTFTADGDEDGDGLTNKQEVELGTNPFRVDTDNDGFSDMEELNFGSDPCDPESTPSRLITAFFEDFSDGDDENWSQNSSFTASWQVKSGTSYSDQYSLCVRGGMTGDNTYYGEVVSGMIKVEPERGYRVSAFVKGKGKLIIYEYDSNGNIIKQHSSKIVDYSDFNLLSATLVTDSETLFIRIGLVSLQDSCTFFDDIKVEWASAMLLYFE